MENIFCCKSCQGICCRVIENVFKVYDNVTYTILKKHDIRVIYSYVILYMHFKSEKNILRQTPDVFEIFSIKSMYSKTCVKRPLKNRQNKDLNDKWYLNEGHKYCRKLSLEHSAILLT